VLTASANSKRAGAQWQICVDAFGFAGGYTQLNYQYQMTSSPLALSLFRHPSLSRSLSLSLCKRIFRLFPLALCTSAPRYVYVFFRRRPLAAFQGLSPVPSSAEEKQRARMQNTRTPTLSAPMQTHIYLSAFPHMRANAQLFFFSCSPGVKRIQQITNLIVMCVCVCGNCCKREESIHIVEIRFLSLACYI